jgi:hypothetical protein
MSAESTLATLRPDLAAMMEFDAAASRQGFIGLKVLKPFEVASASGEYVRVPLEAFLQIQDGTRAPRAAYGRDDWTYTKDSYKTQEYGLEGVVDDNEAACFRSQIDHESATLARTRDNVLRAQEKRIADKVFNTSTWTGASLTTAVSASWATTSTDVIADVNAARKKIWDQTGLLPNTLIVNYWTFLNLRRNLKIIERLEASGAGQQATQAQVTANLVAQCFDLEDILIAGSPYNSANPAVAAATIASIWSTNRAMLAVVSNGAQDAVDACIGRTFHWGEDGSNIGGLVEQYREEQVRGSIIRVRHQVGETIIYKECGHLLTNVNGGTD